MYVISYLQTSAYASLGDFQLTTGFFLGGTRSSGLLNGGMCLPPCSLDDDSPLSQSNSEDGFRTSLLLLDDGFSSPFLI